MAWAYLVAAGLFEIGWPLGLKLGWTEAGARPLWIGFSLICIVVSGASGWTRSKPSASARTSSVGSPATSMN